MDTNSSSDMSSDPTFLQGLESILAPYKTSGASQQTIDEVTQRAHAFYLQSQQQQQPVPASTTMATAAPAQAGGDAAVPTTTGSDTVISSSVSTSDPSSTSTTAFTVDAATASASGPPTSSSTDTPPYPISFTQLAALIASGAPIPGIKDIPDKLAEGEPSRSEVDINTVKKPWQK